MNDSCLAQTVILQQPMQSLYTPKLVRLVTKQSFWTE